YWRSVLASEDFAYDAGGNLIGPDTNPANDVVFTIGDITAPSVAVTAPAKGAVLTASPAQTSGTASDDRRGVLRVMVTLARFSSAGPGTPIQFWNWSTGSFQSNRTVDTRRIAATNDNWANWQKSLPLLTDGFYGVQAKATDRAGNVGSSPWARFSLASSATASSSSRSATTAKLSIAEVSAAGIRLTFTRALDVNDATDPTHYAVEINGRIAAVESVSYSVANSTVTLSVAEGTLRAGDAVIVYWQDLHTAGGAILSGQTGSLTVH
ncbi:MAG TPA: hypothetical protein VNA16_04305, partial [Abditibacteriaceae bacterium]|nr:hypothetical protein [Abditibacteriaceae bacterium]